MVLLSSPFELWLHAVLLSFHEIAFLVVLMSARWIGEIQALTAGPPYTGSVRPHPTFLHKVISDFDINQPIHLLFFFPKTHPSPSRNKLHTGCCEDINLLFGHNQTIQMFIQTLCDVC